MPDQFGRVTAREIKRQVRRDRLALARQFPALFVAPGDGSPKRPLAWSIPAQLRDARALDGDGQPFSRSRAEAAIRDYTRGYRYVRALAQGGPRYGLAGADGAVTEDERQRAIAKLAAIGEAPPAPAPAPAAEAAA